MNKVKRITALLLCLLTAFSLFSVTTVGAKEINTAESFSSYGTVHQYHGAGNAKIQYGGWDGTTDTSNATYLYRVDAINGRAIDMSNYTKTTWYNTSDSFAYCLDPGMKATGDGNYDIAGYWSNDNNVSKALYYMYGGPGYYDNYGSYTVQAWVIQSLQNIIAANNRDGVSSIDGTGEDFQYAFTHLVVSYLNDSSSLDQTDSCGLNWKKEVKWFAENVIPNFSSTPEYFGAYYYNIGASTQRMAGWQIDEVVLQMQKSSSNPELTDNSSCYSLEGAEYQVYYKDASGNAHYVGKITTDANGYGLFENGRKLVKRQYYAKELKAPKGYLLDDSEIPFYVYGSTTADGTTVMHFNHAEKPGNDPVAVVLYKEDAITHERVKALAGAEFTVNFYNDYYDAVADLDGVTPTRSWVIKTDEDGYAELSSDYLVSGDEFYYATDSGNPCLPFGTITIQETKAPDGYQLNEEICLGKITDEGGIGWITGNITTDNNILIEEQPANGYISVHKVNQDNEPVEGAVYGLYTSDEADSDGMLLESNRAATITTDADGNGTFDYASPVGITAYVQEITAPTGYELDKKVYEATPTVDNIEITNPVVVTVIENAITGNLKIVKTSDDNIVDDVWFKVTDSNGKTYEISTQSNGVAELKNLPVYNKDKSLIKYTVSELGFKQTDGSYKIPARYIKPLSVTKTLLDNDTVTFEFNNVVIKGDIVVGKTSDDDVVEGIYFRVTAKNGFSVEDKTDSTGYVRFTDLLKYDNFDNKIEYTITELGFKAEDGSYYLPARYKEAKTFTTTVDGAVNSWSCHNDVKYGDINIEKKSDDGVVEGLYFEITGSNGYNSVVSTNSEGKASVSKLNVYDDDDNLIQYKVKELGVKNSDGTYSFPERYVPTGVQTRTLTTDKAVTYSFENKIKTANVAIKKISDDGVVANVYFKITNNKGEEIGIFGTNSKGYIGGKINNLPVYDIDNNIIEYTATELGFKNEDGTYEIPYRYKAPKSQTFTLSYDETTTITFNNVLKLGSLTLNKSDENGNKLAGAEYELYTGDGTRVLLTQTGSNSYQYSTKGKDNITLVTNSKGTFSVGNLPQGEYYLVETKAPAGFELLKDKISVSISGESSETLYRVVDVKDTVKSVLPLTGGFGSNSGGGMWILLSGTALALLILGAVIYRKHKGPKNRKGCLKMNGIKKLTSLTLMIMMLASMFCVGFTANAAVNPANIDYSKKGSLTLYKYEMPDVSKAVGGATGENTDASKVPADAKPLADVEFTMYKVAELTDYFTTEGVSLPTVSEAEAAVTASTTKFVAKTDSTGVCKFTNLPLAIYLVKETDCPAQVTQTTPSWVMSVPMTNSKQTGWNYDIYSYPKNQTAYSDINLKKIDNDTNEAISNVEFKLQESKDGGVTYTDRLTGMLTNGNGIITVENLPAQVNYRFIETKAASDEWILDNTVSYDFYIDGTGDVLVNNEVVEDKTITAGNEKPSIHKYVLDGEYGTQGIDNTANYGDTVYWEMTASIPSIAAKMNTYKIVDTMSTGLKYTGAVLKLDNKTTLTESTDYTVSQNGLEVTFDIKPEKLAGGKEVEVYFNTELTTAAPMGTDIPNTSKLIYNNNIGVESTHTINSETPNVHTGGYSFIKTNGAKALSGAKFALYKTEADAQANANVLDTQVSDENGLVSFKGLEYGGFSTDEATKAVNGTANGSTDYWIVETEAPSGYILFKDPIKITVNATSHNAESNQNVVNTPKFETPATGGILSSVPFIGGVMLFIGSGLYLVLRRKKSTDE